MHRSISIFGVLSVGFGVIAALAGNAFSATFDFTNSTAIVIPAPGSSAGSEISVSGLGNITNSDTSVVVEVSGFSETHAADVDLVLVGPTGAALALMGDCGGSSMFANLTLTFTDDFPSLIPQSSLTTSGSFKPTQYASIGSFPSPAPGLAYSSPATFGTSTFQSIFPNTNPNGNWSLYVMDPVSGDTGEMARGWELEIEADPAVPEPGSLSLAALAVVGLLKRRRRHNTASRFMGQR